MKNRAAVIVSVVVWALATAGCSREAEKQEPVRPVLSTVLAPTSSAYTVTGTVEPRFKTDLGFRVLGRLIARPVYVGDFVKQDQVVAAIDPTALELAVQSAKADLSRAHAQLVNAKATEDRKRVLEVSDAASKQALDDAEQARAGAEASVARAQANLQKSLEQLGYAQVKADFAGVVTMVAAEVGQVVSPGQSVVTVARPDVREALVDIGTDFPVPLHVGMQFNVSLQLLPAISVAGQIREIAPEADPATRTRRVRISLLDPPDKFRLGSTIRASFESPENSTLRVPESAVLTRDGKKFVWLVDSRSKTVSLHKLELLADTSGLRVTGGLDAGARIVTAGIHSLKDGQKVRIDDGDATP